MTFTRTRRAVAIAAAASCMALPASAAADGLPSTFRSDAAQSARTATGSPGSDAAQSGSRGDATRSSATSPGSDAAQSGGTSTSTFPPAGFRGGDNPADHPGMSGAPAATPTTIEVVRPERTIVREVDEALPIVLSGTALLLVLAGLGFTLARARMLPRRSH